MFYYFGKKQKEPKISKKEPVNVYNEPKIPKKEPVKVYQEPVKVYQEPVKVYQEPVKVYQEKLSDSEGITFKSEIKETFDE